MIGLPTGLSSVGDSTRAPSSAFDVTEPIARHDVGGLLGGQTPVPLLVVGWILGPQGAGIVSSEALSVAAPALPVALAAMGAALGQSIAGGAPSRGVGGRAVGHGLASVAVVAAFVYAGSILLALPTTTAALLATVCGVSAASSLRPRGADATGGWDPVDTLMIVEAGVAIAAGATVVALAVDDPAPAAARLAQGCGMAVLLAGAGWLLLRRTASVTERRVLAVSTLLLVGGAADFTSASPLLAGLTAGALWQRMGGPAREALGGETRAAQRPSLGLVLVWAGAATELSALVVWLGLLYAVSRAAVRRASMDLLVPSRWRTDRDLRRELVSPGVFGVALAVGATRTLGLDAASTVLSVVIVGTCAAALAGAAASRGRS